MAARPRTARRVARALHRRRDVLDSAAGESGRPADHLVDRLRRPAAARSPRASVPASTRPRADARSAHRAPDRQRPGRGSRRARRAHPLDARAGRIPPRAPAGVGCARRASPASYRRWAADRRQAGRPREFGSGAGQHRVFVLMGGVPRYGSRSGLALLLATLAIWQLAMRFEHPDFVMGPLEIARHFGEALRSGELLPHIGASLARSVPGFVVGSLAGVVLGLLASVSRSLDQLLSPVVFLTYPVPKIVFLPIVMLWVGIGDVSKIAVIALACFYPCFINAYYGARGTSTIMVWSGLSMGARRSQIFRKVVVPSALPLVFAGLRVSLALSFILLFSTEMINARSGLGFLIRQSESSLRFDLMYVAIVAVAALGYASDQLLLLARRRVLAWQAAPTR